MYSSKPPNIAPNIFEESAILTDFSIDNCFEKASPEKKIGIVKTVGTINFKKDEGKFDKSKYVT